MSEHGKIAIKAGAGGADRRGLPRRRASSVCQDHAAVRRPRPPVEQRRITAPSVPLEDLTYEQWKSVVDVNLTGAFLCTQEAFRIMRSQDPVGGRIINNGSISAYVPRPNFSPYSATKHVIAGLTKSTSLDGRKYDIGNAGTGMAEVFKTGVPQANGTIAPEPTLDPEHVAQVVVYMASLPLDINVQVMTVMATKTPYIRRG